jgi:preprotein translocase subunit SecE
MAKSRAQRKAEAAKRRARAEQGIEVERDAESKAAHDTQVPESADVLEAEMSMELGADGVTEDEALQGSQSAEPEAPAPARGPSRRELKRQERDAAKRAKESAARRTTKEPVQEREHGAIRSFFASVVKELRKVQWPDRDTLVQASAVTLIFVAIAAAYLGILDAIFSRLIDLLI